MTSTASAVFELTVRKRHGCLDDVQPARRNVLSVDRTRIFRLFPSLVPKMRIRCLTEHPCRSAVLFVLAGVPVVPPLEGDRVVCLGWATGAPYLRLGRDGARLSSGRSAVFHLPLRVPEGTREPCPPASSGRRGGRKSTHATTANSPLSAPACA